MSAQQFTNSMNRHLKMPSAADTRGPLLDAGSVAPNNSAATATQGRMDANNVANDITIDMFRATGRRLPPGYDFSRVPLLYRLGMLNGIIEWDGVMNAQQFTNSLKNHTKFPAK